MTDHESPMERAKRLTGDEVASGRLLPWVMDRVDGPKQRDRFNAAKDRRANFGVIDNAKLKGVFHD